jgi:hypothetical protein
MIDKAGKTPGVPNRRLIVLGLDGFSGRPDLQRRSRGKRLVTTGAVDEVALIGVPSREYGIPGAGMGIDERGEQACC